MVAKARTGAARGLVSACGALLLVLAGSPSQGGEVVEYYHLDAIGNVRAVTNAAGQVVERHDYLPFGEECTTGPCATNPALDAGQPRKFTSKERDPETGLDYFGARYYGSKIGRFTTTDPVYTTEENTVDPQRWNRYAYARNNPLRYTDPDGRFIATVTGTLIGGTGGALFAAIQGNNVWAGAAGGATAGALFGLVIDTAGTAALGYGALAATGGLSAGTGLAVERTVSGEPLFTSELMVGVTAGAALGPAAKLGASSPSIGASAAAEEAGAQYFRPGPFAGEGVSLRGAGRLNAAERAGVNAEGNALGCRTCGTSAVGTKSGSWIGDHQPVSALNKSGAPQRGYPHCATCSATQGGYASQAVKRASDPQ
jgi:RHS repeat-associated protein